MKHEHFLKYAVVDLEATGAHAAAEIIQVGIVIIENNQITKTYQTDVNPHEPLSEHIIQLTGITDDQLAKAPDFLRWRRNLRLDSRLCLCGSQRQI